MIVINTVSSKRFSLNGIEYLKNFLSFVVGDRLLIYNAYDRRDERCDLTLYSEFEVNGVAYGSASLLQTALLDVIYTRLSLGGAVVANFYQLLDTFTYLGRNGHFVRVNPTATGLESVYSNILTDDEKIKLAGVTYPLEPYPYARLTVAQQDFTVPADRTVVYATVNGAIWHKDHAFLSAEPNTFTQSGTILQFKTIRPIGNLIIIYIQ
jgi:hypothetical protein